MRSPISYGLADVDAGDVEYRERHTQRKKRIVTSTNGSRHVVRSMWNSLLNGIAPTDRLPERKL